MRPENAEKSSSKALTTVQAVAAYGSAAGAFVLLVGGGVSLLAYRVMLRVARLPDEQRVLR